MADETARHDDELDVVDQGPNGGTLIVSCMNCDASSFHLRKSLRLECGSCGHLFDLFGAAWTARAQAQDAVIPIKGGHFVIGPLDFMRTEAGWDICLNDEAIITDTANDALNALADILKTAAPAQDERGDAERFRWLLERNSHPDGWKDTICLRIDTEEDGSGDIRALIDADRDREGAR